MRRFAPCVLALSLASLVAQEPAGYRDPDVGFAGRFEDLATNRLELAPAGGGFKGVLTLGVEYQIDARVDGEGLRGTATVLNATEAFTAHWRDGKVRARVGAHELVLERTVEPLPALTRLGDVVPDEARCWTIAVYLGADNDLELGALLDLQEMIAGLPEKGVEVIALIDRAKGHAASEPDWTDTRVVRIRPASEGGIVELAKPGELDTADPRVLAGFVAGALRTFPAPHHAVIVWSHGSGWRGIVEDHDCPGHEGARMLSLEALRVGLTAGLIHGAVARLDLLAFDACLMSHLEVAVEMVGRAQVMLASQAMMPGTGFPYDRFLPKFAASDDPRAIVRTAVPAFAAASDALDQGGATLSALDLDRIGAVAQRLDAFAGKLAPSLDVHWPGLARAVYFAESYQPRTARGADAAVASVDLLDLLERVHGAIQPFPAEAELVALQGEIAGAVLATYGGEQRRLSKGLSVWAPHRTAQFVPRYATTWVGAGNRWTGVLQRLHAAAAAKATAAEVKELRVLDHAGNPAAQSVSPGGGCTLHGTVTGVGVVQVQQWDMVQAGEQWLVLRKNFVADPLWTTRIEQAAADEIDLVMPQFADGETPLRSELVGLGFAVSDGPDMAIATIDLATPSTQAPYVVHALLTEPGADAQQVVIEFHRAWWSVQGVFVAEGVKRQLAPSKDAAVQVLVETVAASGERAWMPGATFQWGTGLRLLLRADPPGRYRAALRAETIDGRGFDASTDYDLVASPVLQGWAQTWQPFDAQLMNGTWHQELVVGPEQFQDTGVRNTFEEPDPAHASAWRVTCKLPGEGDTTSRQRWLLSTDGTPSLRIVTQIEDGRTYVVYGPARFGMADDRPFVAMKGLNAGGVLWRWHKSRLSSLLLRGK